MPYKPASRVSASDEGYSVNVSHATFHAQLKRDGLSNDAATKSASFLVRVSDFIQQNHKLRDAFNDTIQLHDVYTGAVASVETAPYVGDLNKLIQSRGISGAASVMGVFVDRFGALADSQGIELNKCALSVAKLATDIGGAGVGAVTSASGIGSPLGAVLTGIAVMSTINDSRSFVNECLPSSNTPNENGAK